MESDSSKNPSSQDLDSLVASSTDVSQDSSATLKPNDQSSENSGTITPKDDNNDLDINASDENQVNNDTDTNGNMNDEAQQDDADDRYAQAPNLDTIREESEKIPALEKEVIIVSKDDTESIRCNLLLA
ncbi:unnamed protein product [Owenia fusiformis]|uniref:Uncharacterized protein n=1 Tax=Owenia fusiformis TaxID=6347 RepID=A0A8J1XS62_OWEFU|nr:unnamed protein product [Owenia fusiformis]